MSPAMIALLVLFPAAMAYAAASDLLTMTIPNRLCLLLIAGFAFCAFWLQLPLVSLGWHLAAGGLVLVVSFGLFAAGWIGGGDAKLAAATALWLGFEQLSPYLMVAGLAGGALTLAIVLLRRTPLPQPLARWRWLARLHSPKEGVPYGIALAFAALVVLPETVLWRSAVLG